LILGGLALARDSIAGNILLVFLPFSV